MSYTKTPQALGISIGGLVSKGVDLFQQAQPALRVGVKVLEDPYLPQASCEVMRLSRLEQGRAAGPRCAAPRPTAAQARKGVGLRYTVTPLRALIFHKQHPWVAPVVLVGVLGSIFYMGYAIGKDRK